MTHEIFLNSKSERQVFGVAGRAWDSCAGVGGFRVRLNISGTTKFLVSLAGRGTAVQESVGLDSDRM